MFDINFKDLATSKAIGTFFLQIELEEFTTQNNLRNIVKKANEIYDAFVKGTDKVFSPVFSFSIAERRVKVSIHEPERRTSELKHIGDFILVQVFDVKKNDNVLSLETNVLTWTNVKKIRKQKVSFNVIEKFINSVIDIVDNITVITLKDFIRLYSVIIPKSNETFNFDIFFTNKNIIIKIYRNNILYQTTQLSILK